MGLYWRGTWLAMLATIAACASSGRECEDDEVLDGLYCIDAPLTEDECVFPNDWVEGACYFRPDWSDEDLSGMDLSGAGAGGLVMNRTNLAGANLANADLSNTDLTDAILDLSLIHI